MTLLVVAAFSLTLWALLGFDWFLGMRRMTVLRDAEVTPPETYPKLSVIIPALNEARGIEASLRSVLEQDYPHLEVIVVNDRSTDETGEILERMKARYARLEVVHIRELPEGWLGKTHALYVGAQQATGDWLLFTDADVRYAPGALTVTVAYALQHNLDHLAALPHFVAKSIWLRSFESAFALLFSVYSQLWRAKNPRSKAHIGIGAFGLVRREVYERVGTHRAIALRPDDDLKLGKVIKHHGYRQEAVFATDQLSLEWYPSVKEAVRGLNKNAFAGLEYSLPITLMVTCLLLLTNVFPFVAVCFTSGLTQLLFAAIIGIVLFVYAYNARFSKLPARYFILHPYAVTLLVYAALESAVKALARGQISWRGTVYPLAELKRNKV